jgi:hypothetical protein
VINRNAGFYAYQKNPTVGEFAIREAETFQSLIPSTPQRERGSYVSVSFAFLLCAETRDKGAAKVLNTMPRNRIGQCSGVALGLR